MNEKELKECIEIVLRQFLSNATNDLCAVDKALDEAIKLIIGFCKSNNFQKTEELNPWITWTSTPHKDYTKSTSKLRDWDFGDPYCKTNKLDTND